MTSPRNAPTPPSPMAAMLRQRDLVALLAAAVCLLAALVNPTWPVERPLFEHVVVLDITQSMDVRDMPGEGDGPPRSRLAAAKAALHRALLDLPCGSRIGWGVFTEHRTQMVLMPVEVCEHLAELRATLARIDGRMAWSGNSEVAKGLHSALRQLVEWPGRPSLLFVTDGHEAPPLDARQRPRFDGKAGDVAGAIVGIGGAALQPIPRSDPSGRPIGTWGPDDVMQVDPFAHSRGGSVGGETMQAEQPARPGPGATPGREHLSSLREGYLRLLASETGLAYATGGTAPAMTALLTRDELARPVRAPWPLRGLLVVLALIALVAPWLSAAWRRWRHRDARRVRPGLPTRLATTHAGGVARVGVSAASAPGTRR